MLFLRQAKPNIRRYLPTFIFSDKTADAIARANNSEHEALRLAVADVANQFYVETATWGLMNWERVLNIPTVVSDGYEARRKRILLKLQSHQVSTKKFMVELINRYTSDNSGFLIEQNEEYWFKYGANIDGVEYWGELVNAINTYKPAHLGGYLTLQNLQNWMIQHANTTMQCVKLNHCVWNLGAARSTYWDGEFCWDGTIRYDGIYPDELYRERQLHTAKIIANSRTSMPIAVKHNHRIYGIGGWRQSINIKHENKINQVVKSNQATPIKNAVKPMQTADLNQKTSRRYTNMWDGSFCWDSSHTWEDVQESEKLISHACSVRTISKNGTEGVRETI